MSPVAAWIFSLIVFLAPPDRLARRRTFPEAVETVEVKTARYESIANDVEAVITSEPPLFGGRDAQIKTAALLVSVAFFESGFRRDVDLGIGAFARGDFGASYCMMQIHVGRGTTMDGWTGEELVSDREKCLRAGLKILRNSMLQCHALAPRDRLSAYTTGKCQPGDPGAMARHDLAARLYVEHPIQ